jgi:hypothetical protein
MMVAIGPVFLLLASVLLGAVILLAGYGIILLISRHRRQTYDRTRHQGWQRDPTVMAGRSGASTMAAPGK